MSPAHSSVESGSETRDDLLRVSDLWSYFCERTFNDARYLLVKETSSPSVAIIFVCALASGFFVYFDNPIMYLMGAITVAQLLWFVFAKASSGSNKQLQALEGIREGDFPAAISESVIKRLRWWNYLIVPTEWTQSSRIFELRAAMQARIGEIDSEIGFWNSDDGRKKTEELTAQAQEADARKQEQNKKLRYLQSRGVHVTALEENAPELGEENLDNQAYYEAEVLTRAMVNTKQRDAQMVRIGAIVDQIERISQERVFVEAMLLKIQKIANLLEAIDGFRPPIETVNAKNLNESVRPIVNVLEQRRSLVLTVNRIHQAEVLKLLGYSIGFIREKQTPHS